MADDTIRRSRETFEKSRRLQAEHGALLEETKRQDAAMEEAMRKTPQGWGRAKSKGRSPR